jgi:hypothetical protein
MLSAQDIGGVGTISYTRGTVQQLDIAEELDEQTDKVSVFFPKQPPQDILHIIVKLPIRECRWLNIPAWHCEGN